MSCLPALSRSNPEFSGCTPAVPGCSKTNSEPKFTKVKLEQRLIGVGIMPTPPPPIIVESNIPEKLLKIMAKYKPENWRLDKLCLPRTKQKKFVPQVVKLITSATKPRFRIKMTPEKTFYADQMSKAKLRILVKNKEYFKNISGRRWVRAINKNIFKSWRTIYNFYKLKQRNAKRAQLKRLQTKAKKPESRKDFLKKHEESYQKLATPKPDLSKNIPIVKGKVISPQGLEHCSELATPPNRPELPQNKPGVSKAALEYQITESVAKLAELPKRFAKEKYVDPFKVKRSALRYVATEKFLELTKPTVRHCDGKVIQTKTEEDLGDPFKVSESALKYKITARVKELAKPKERK